MDLPSLVLIARPGYPVEYIASPSLTGFNSILADNKKAIIAVYERDLHRPSQSSCSLIGLIKIANIVAAQRLHHLTNILLRPWCHEQTNMIRH